MRDEGFDRKIQEEIGEYLNKIDWLGKDIVKATEQIRAAHYEIMMRKHFLGQANTVVEEGVHGPYV